MDVIKEQGVDWIHVHDRDLWRALVDMAIKLPQYNLGKLLSSFATVSF
jgi:hypothetical protein